MRTGIQTHNVRKRTTEIAHLQDGTPEVPGEQHLQEITQREFKGKCFKCDRKGHPSYKCTETMKEDGTPVNSNDASNKLYDAKIKESADRRARFRTGGTQMFIGEEIVPTFDELFETEEENEGMAFTSCAFHQDQQNIEIDLTRCENHAYNQASTNLDRFDILCDNQSTSDVIVERCFVSNIRKCK